MSKTMLEKITFKSKMMLKGEVVAPPKKISLQELEHWHSVQSAREELGLSRQGVRNLLTRGDLLGVKTRVGWLIDPASVRAFALLQQDDAEREKRAERDALVARATGGGSGS